MKRSPEKKLRDKQAKGIFREHWPIQPTFLSADGERWIRANPWDARATMPRIATVGHSRWKTQPDAFYLHLSPTLAFADVIAIEVCGTSQNFQDKKARYAPSHASRTVVISRKWLESPFKGKGGGQKIVADYFDLRAEERTRDCSVPVRHLRVLFSLPNDEYNSVKRDLTPAAHEYYCRHTSLRSTNAPGFREFLGRMTFRSHYYAFDND